jgi:hypothetical protein
MKVRLLLSTQRSGSHFLKSLIESRFSSIVCSGEVLEEPVAFVRQFPALASHPEFPHFWLWYALAAGARSISVAPDRRIEAFGTYLSQLSALAKPKDLLVDIKCNTIRALSGYWDTDHGSSDFAAFIASRQIPILHLIRKNILRVIVSQQLARQTGVWHRTENRPASELMPKIHLNTKRLLAEIQQAHRLTQDYQTLFRGQPGYEEIVYEDVVREREYVHSGVHLRALGHFLEKKCVPPHQMDLPFKKMTPEDLSEVVDNWPEVLRALRGTECGWMAETPLLAAA